MNLKIINTVNVHECTLLNVYIHNDICNIHYKCIMCKCVYNVCVQGVRVVLHYY